MKAVLLSSHQEVERIDVEDLGELWCMAGNPNAEDLIKVIGTDGKTAYWCDSIEFIKEDAIITHENEWWWGTSYTLITNDGLATIELCVENNEDRNYYGTIQSLMVHPSVRRKGLGNVMLKFAEEKAKELGLQQVVVVARKDTFLIPWYQRCGYEIYDDNVKESEGRTVALNKYL